MKERFKNERIVLKAMLDDEELMRGGIFSKEKYYMEKYGFTQREMDNMSMGVYFALRKEYTIRVEQ